MKQYTVEITDEALADMEEIYNHIAYVLRAPENAKGIRRMLVDNYSVFYVIRDDRVIVYVVLAVFNAILSGVNVFLYEKNRKKDT